MRKHAFFTVMLCCSALALGVTAQGRVAQAADGVVVRASVQNGFIRLVFSSDTLPKADVDTVEKDGLKITFNKAVALSGLEDAVKGITPTLHFTKQGENVLLVKTDTLARHRNLVLGNRLFVDLFTKNEPSERPVDAKAAKITPEKKPVEGGELSAAPVSIVETDKGADDANRDVADKIEEKLGNAANNKPAKSIEEAKAAFTGTAMITVGSTQGLSLASFIRAGYLWIVLSQEKVSVPPLVSGPDAQTLGVFEPVAITGGSAYRMKLPQGANIRPQGGGLVWRLYVEGTHTNLSTIQPEADFSDNAQGPLLHLPLKNAASALRVPDPLIGDDLAVITVARADTRLISDDKYVDFDLLPAIVGAVIRPKADGMRIAVLDNDVTVSRQGGMRLSAMGPRGKSSLAHVQKPGVAEAGLTKREVEPTRFFDFKTWALGGPSQFLEMRRSIDARVAVAMEERKLPELLNGAKFMLAQGLPQEGLGFLQMAQSYLPALKEAADFQALNGAILALMGESDDAIAAFSTQGLEKNDEIALWHAYALARAGKGADALKTMPPTTRALLASYPERLQTQLIPPLLEVVLARGDVDVAEAMLEAYDKASFVSLDFDRDNAVSYYRARVAQLRGDIDAGTNFYREAAEGIQGPYPVRATLALVERGLSDRTISRPDAIRKLERFRYGWRGDTLESQILERLGLVYVTGGEQRRGLTILRDAATMTSDVATREKLVAVMQKAFRELFSGKTKEKMTPLESASVATEFAELMPAGGDGEGIAMTIADQMVAVDLLDRAADMIEPLVGHTEKLSDALRYAQRAGAIRLLNDQPEDTLKIVDKAMARPDARAQKTLPPANLKALSMLRAKAKAELKRPDEALAELAKVPEDGETLRLVADISWGAQKWDVAAAAFAKLVSRANLSATRPVTREQAQLVMNQALALNLSGDNAKLESLRVSYGDVMRRSELSQPFQVVTRTAQDATLADRETLLKLVSEVNMFKDVLDSYKTSATPTKAVPANSQSDQKAELPAAAEKK